MQIAFCGGEDQTNAVEKLPGDEARETWSSCLSRRMWWASSMAVPVA